MRRPQRSVIRIIIYAVACNGVDAFQLYPFIAVSQRRRYPCNIYQQLSKTSSDDDDDNDGGLVERPKNTLTFTQMDANSDGKVSLSELKMGLEKELKVCCYIDCSYHMSSTRYYNIHIAYDLIYTSDVLFNICIDENF